MSTLPATHNDNTFNSDSEWNDIDSVQSSTTSPRISIDSHSKVTLPIAANSPTTPAGRNGTFRNIRNLKILLPLRQSSNNLLEPSHPSPNSKANVFRPQSPVNTTNSNHYAPSTTSVPSSMKSPAAAAHLLDEVLSHLSPKRTESSNSLSTLAGPLDANRAHVGIDSPKDSPAPSKKTLGINENFAAKIGDYIVEQTIGEGSYGKVKLATHTITGEKVALKILDKAAINRTSTSAERVLREIVVLKSLYHPNICQLLQVIDYSRDIYLVFKFEEGGELYHHIVKNGRLKERKARKIFIQILGAIQYCHANGIVHRDLKLENILMDSQGNIKIIDFGFTNIMQAGELLSTFCGSAAYAAPEMISGQKYTGPEVDVWSMGIILYALVCGALPFDDPNVSKMFMKIMKGDLHYPKHLSKDCKDLISHILKLSPAERYTVEQIRDHPWITKDGTTVTWYTPNEQSSLETTKHGFNSNNDITSRPMSQEINAPPPISTVSSSGSVTPTTDSVLPFSTNSRSVHTASSALVNMNNFEFEVDHSILQKMSLLGFDPDETLQKLSELEPSSHKATYFLLRDKQDKEKRLRPGSGSQPSIEIAASNDSISSIGTSTEGSPTRSNSHESTDSLVDDARYKLVDESERSGNGWEYKRGTVLSSTIELVITEEEEPEGS